MKKIIVIAVNTGIGNVLMITPMIEEIKKKFRYSNISVLVSNEACKKVLGNNPNIKDVIVLQRRNRKLENFFPISGLKQFIRLRKEKFDVSFTIMPHSYYGSFCALWIGAEKRISHNLCLADFLQTKLIGLRKIHDVVQNIYLVSSNYNMNPSLKIWLRQGERKSKLVRNVGIHVGCDANSEFKRWPIENFIRLGKKLVDNNFSVTFFVGPDEMIFREIIEREGVFEVIKEDDLRKMIARLGRCEYFISNDSGVMHIAEALGVFLIVLFGASDYRRSGPMPNKKSIILTPKKYRPWSYSLDEIAGRKIPIGDGSNVRDISVERVYNSFLKLIDKRKS
jgi:ADP-heptose:LPS heptosyltransferase